MQFCQIVLLVGEIEKRMFEEHGDKKVTTLGSELLSTCSLLF